LSEHSLEGVLHNVKQDVLLTEGEDDHLFNTEWLYRIMGELVYARSVTARGIVTRTSSQERTSRVGWADAADLLCSPPVPAGGHPARRVVVPPVHAELPGRRRPAGRAWSRHLLRNRPALGAEIRAGLRQEAPSASAETQLALASR
jgi:hypothetical protein